MFVFFLLWFDRLLCLRISLRVDFDCIFLNALLALRCSLFLSRASLRFFFFKFFSACSTEAGLLAPGFFEAHPDRVNNNNAITTYLNK